MLCTLTRADGARIHTFLTLTPVRYGANALGGPDAATVAVSGDKNALSDVLTWLACKITIYNDGGLPVWWGLVQVASVMLDGVEYTLDASEIVNRMAVLYTDESGAAAQTLWVEDAHSISLYGRREVRQSVRAETTTTATAQATRYIAERAQPLRSVGAASGQDGATLLCVGLWRTLDWRYWTQDAGEEVRNESDNATELLGWAITSDAIGFNRPLLRIGSLAADMVALVEADRIIASGSTSNDGLYEVAEPDDRLATTAYTSAGIYFDPSDDVHDGDGLLNMFRPGDLVSITGSTSNDGEYFIKDFFQNGDGGYDHMRVYPGTIVEELAGGSQTITAGNSIGVVERPAAYELPGATITLTSQATKIAYGFFTSGSIASELSEVWLKAAAIGSPADNLVVEVWSAAGSVPGSLLATASVAGSALPQLDVMDWVQWTYDSSVSLAAGTFYFVVVSRSGSADDAAYRLGISEGVSGPGSDYILLWNGSAWVARSVASELDGWLALRVYGTRLTTTQIVNIVDGVGDWLSDASIRTASGLRTRMYRGEEQAQTALSEIKALLEFGTSGGGRLLATVTVDGALLVDAAPSATSPRYIWTAQGLRDRWGLPLAQGWLPVGEWVAFEMASLAETFGAAFLEAAEYDVASGAVRPSFRAEQAVQALARMGRAASVPDLAVRIKPYLR